MNCKNHLKLKFHFCFSFYTVKVPIRDGLKNWAECIDTDKKNVFLFKFDEKNKDTFKHLQFELQNNDSKELKMIK